MPSYAYRRMHWASYADAALRRGREGRPFKRWKAEVLKGNALRCCRCGGPIDKSLPWRHPWSATADHYPIPLSLMVDSGQPLDPAYGRPAHRRCNLSAGNGSPSRVTRRSADRRW